jgi:putative transposase
MWELMNDYRKMTNDVIRIGIANGNVSTLKRLSILSYRELKKRYRDAPSYYKLCAISKASGILASRNKSIKRGHDTKDPYVKRPLLVSCYGFKIVNGRLRIPIANNRKYEFIELTKHTLDVLKDNSIMVRSFTLTPTSLSLSIAKEVPEIEVSSAIGIDRNLRNLTVGNASRVTYYDMSKVVEIGETTKDIVKSFRRNDVRTHRRIASKYGRRKKERVNNLLNKISKGIAFDSIKIRQAVIFEDITFIRSMYQKGNGQGNDYRGRMNNNWPFAEIKRQVEYKARWLGIPVIQLTKSETRGTSSICYACGERLQSSREKPRLLWCEKCEKWYDRDLVAVMNISHKGWMRFVHSKGIGGEALNGNPTTGAAIPRVDPMKLQSSAR